MAAPQSSHTSKGYDHQLAQAHALVLQMGARVERQARDAIECLASGSPALIDQVLRHELVINSLERSIDALAMLRHALDAFERLDLEGTADVVRRDADVNDAFRGILHQLILAMVHDPRTISAGLGGLFVAKAPDRLRAGRERGGASGRARKRARRACARLAAVCHARTRSRRSTSARTAST